MKEKLPKVYVNPIDHNIKNSQDMYRSDRSDTHHKSDNLSINDIDTILNDRHHIFKSKVEVILKNNDVRNKVLVSRINDNLLFMDGEKININDIKRISLK